jgi:hypothetical protein
VGFGYRAFSVRVFIRMHCCKIAASSWPGWLYAKASEITSGTVVIGTSLVLFHILSDKNLAQDLESNSR